MLVERCLKLGVSKRAVVALLVCSCVGLSYARAKEPRGPYALTCDSLTAPLGDDNPHPALSWKLSDATPGARQSAYRISVASSQAALAAGHADVWDSGKIDSAQSVHVAYAGPGLRPETRYWWRVEVWDGKGHPYLTSQASWWETGLMGQEHWSADWISYEDKEQTAVRAAHAAWVTDSAVSADNEHRPTRHELRLVFRAPEHTRKAVLYVTGEDTAAAWINGAEVLQPAARPPWGRTPWRTYRRVELTGQLRPGRNVLAAEVTRFEGASSPTAM